MSGAVFVRHAPGVGGGGWGEGPHTAPGNLPHDQRQCLEPPHPHQDQTPHDPCFEDPSSSFARACDNHATHRTHTPKRRSKVMDGEPPRTSREPRSRAQHPFGCGWWAVHMCVWMCVDVRVCVGRAQHPCGCGCVWAVHNIHMGVCVGGPCTTSMQRTHLDPPPALFFFLSLASPTSSSRICLQTDTDT